MSQQSGTEPDPNGAGRGEDETTLSAGAPGPSGTGGLTDAGADPDAPSAADISEESR